MGVVPAIGWTASTAMAAERIVIVGAGPAGFATARAYREHGGEGSVTLLGEEPLLPYERPHLTKDFLRGELDAVELPIEQEEWFHSHDVQLRLGVRATAIDPRGETVTVAGDAPLRADAIVLATGSEPMRGDVPGIDDPLVMTMRALPDSIAVSARAHAGEPALVIGTGFIGCEIAASLAMRGAQVTLIGQESLPQIERLGEDVAGHIAGWLKELGVELIGDATVSAVDDGQVVELEGGSRLRGSCIVLGMGVRPRGRLAEAAGLRMSGGAVIVDEAMRSLGSHGILLAVGDVACAHNAGAGRHLRVEHWGDALEHGEVAGRTLAGQDGRWESVPGFWSTIGTRTMKYAAWGDGYEESRLVSHPDGGFTVWYSRGSVAVGVLTYDCDEDYERGSELIRRREPAP